MHHSAVLRGFLSSQSQHRKRHSALLGQPSLLGSSAIKRTAHAIVQHPTEVSSSEDGGGGVKAMPSGFTSMTIMTPISNLKIKTRRIGSKSQSCQNCRMSQLSLYTFIIRSCYVNSNSTYYVNSHTEYDAKNHVSKSIQILSMTALILSA